MTAFPIILIVDDNRNYRQAFGRNLMLQGYEVAEAEDSDEALERLSEKTIDVVVTDLSMRHPTEGLDLIKQIRSLKPHLPIIMISAVGTFEEGAEASRLGARYVISKSKIDEEMGNLFQAIDHAYAEYQKSLKFAQKIKDLSGQAETDRGHAVAELRQIITNPEAPETIKSEAYDLIMELNASELAQASLQDLDRAKATDAATRLMFEKADANLQEALPQFQAMEHDSREALRTAEFLYLHGENIERGVDFSRSIGFSYCFAVENEAKARLRKRLVKFFSDPATPRLIQSLLEKNGKSLSLFFHQHLLRVQREFTLEVTIDNVYQTFSRILEHGGKYKPDGLKALGIIVLCFGRKYSFRHFEREVVVDNPLGLKGFENQDDVLRFAMLLSNLQHYRNPYIHPEISEMEKLSKIRETSFDCLNLMRYLD
jgi:CheY-like chemotaxis protein